MVVMPRILSGHDPHPKIPLDSTRPTSPIWEVGVTILAVSPRFEGDLEIS